MKEITVQIKKKTVARDLPVPSYATNGSSGVDLFADVDGDLVLEPGVIKLISCGIYVSIPEGFEAQIRPRSGLALKLGISLVNSPGTIDSDYRGLISLIVINHGKDPYTVKRGIRLAQMTFHEVLRANFDEVEDLDETVRAHGGFGHTGV